MITRRCFVLGVGACAALAQTRELLAVASAAGTQPAASTNTMLLVDDFHVLYRPLTQRILHPLTRRSEPLIPGGDVPWARNIAYCSVHRDTSSGKYQMWYQAYAGSTARDRTRRCTVCYAESKDGLNWQRPSPGLFDFDGRNDTNIVLVASAGKSDRYGGTVIVDPREPDLSRRYKMAYFDFARDSGIEYPGLCVAFSPDGIHWTKHPEAPLLRCAYGDREPVPFADEQEKRRWDLPLSMSDAFDVMFDPLGDQFALYGKMWIDGPDGRMYGKHAMGRTTSRDFINWSQPELLMTPDELDAPIVEFHTTPVFFHAGVYFACPQILNRNENNGVMDVELATSRDGRSFARPFRKTFFLPRGKPDAFDGGSVFTNSSPIVLDDEIRFYYGGYSAGATGPREFVDKSGIGLATMKRDRFAGIRPIEKVAQITMRPLELSGLKSIQLNANASRGSIRVELLDEHGRRVRGFAQEDAVPLTTDSLRHELKWKDKQLSDLPPGRYMLRLHLTQAEVFALTLDRVNQPIR